MVMIRRSWINFLTHARIYKYCFVEIRYGSKDVDDCCLTTQKMV